MKLRILGAAPGMPTPGLHHAAVAVHACVRTFLLDAGEGVSNRLKQTYLDGEALDFVAVSHYHPDHVAGLFMLLQMLKLQHRRKPLDLYLPERVEDMGEILRMFYTFPAQLKFPLRMLPMEELHTNEPCVLPVASDHMQGYRDIVRQQAMPNACKAWSFVVSEQDRRAIYTADIQSLEPLQPHLGGTNLLIIDALHPPATEIAALGAGGITRIVLTHGLAKGLGTLPEQQATFEIADETLDYDV